MNNTRVEPLRVKRIGVVMTLLGLLVMLMPLTALGNDHQIRICHATGSESNPYTNPLVPKHQIDAPDGHGSFVDGVHPDDIIPPFAAGSQGSHSWPAYPGKNWPEGQALLLNNCQVPGEEPDTFSLVVEKAWDGDETDLEGITVTFEFDPGDTGLEDGDVVTITENVDGALPEGCTFTSNLDVVSPYTVNPGDADDDGVISLTVTNTVDCEDTTTSSSSTTTTTIGTEVGGFVVTTSTAPVVAVTPDEVLDTAVEAEELPFTGLDSDQLVGMAVLLLAGGLVLLGVTGRREES